MPSSSARRTRTTTIVRIPTLNCRQGDQPGNWRLIIPPGGRQRIVNKIVESLKWCCRNAADSEIYDIASLFEQKVYTDAISKRDYLRKISSKMLPFETLRRVNSVANAERVAANQSAAS
ncbi:putative coactivator CBP, KIX domain superfamily, mediator complex subunit 15, KIX [Dioscorea sansibarensis]